MSLQQVNDVINEAFVVDRPEVEMALAFECLKELNSVTNSACCFLCSFGSASVVFGACQHCNWDLRDGVDRYEISLSVAIIVVWRILLESVCVGVLPPMDLRPD